MHVRNTLMNLLTQLKQSTDKNIYTQKKQQTVEKIFLYLSVLNTSNINNVCVS